LLKGAAPAADIEEEGTKMLIRLAATAAALGCTAALAVLVAPAAEAARCGDVTKGGWTAVDVRATHLSCRSARVKLGRWLPPPLPRNQVGWYCDRLGRRHLCSAGSGDPPRLTFLLRRRAAAAGAASRWKRCGSWDGTGPWGYEPPGFGYFNVRALNLSCRTARRVVRAYRSWEYDPDTRASYGEGRFRDWVCLHRSAGYEATRTRCRAPGGRRVRWVSAA
jgi:hypothetical protein